MPEPNALKDLLLIVFSFILRRFRRKNKGALNLFLLLIKLYKL